jgi:hypothetical protein
MSGIFSSDFSYLLQGKARSAPLFDRQMRAFLEKAGEGRRALEHVIDGLVAIGVM